MITPAIIKAFSGDITYETKNDNNSNSKIISVATPVLNSNGNVIGVVYISGPPRGIYDTLSDINIILLNAILIALFITIILGYFLSGTITGPIKEVTKYAHETIKSYTETLLNDDVKSKFKSQFLNIIDKEVDRMTRLVKDLLLLSKMDSNSKLKLWQ